jgi:hypothetical protein
LKSEKTLRLPPPAFQPRLFSDPPFSGGIGSAVFGGALATGAFVLLPLLDSSLSLLLQAARTQSKTASSRIRGFNRLNISLQIIRTSGLVRVAGKRFARHSILTFDPAAEVNELAAFRTKWTKGIVFPLGRFTAGWALHESRNTCAGDS